MIINPLDIAGYLILTTIILFLISDRWMLIERDNKEKDRLFDELSKTVKAVISKNANEYVMTTSIDKVPSEEKPAMPADEIPEETLSDDQFFEAVGRSLEKNKK